MAPALPGAPVRRQVLARMRFHEARAREAHRLLSSPSHREPCSVRSGSPRRWFGWLLTVGGYPRKAVPVDHRGLVEAVLAVVEVLDGEVADGSRKAGVAHDPAPGRGREVGHARLAGLGCLGHLPPNRPEESSPEAPDAPERRAELVLEDGQVEVPADVREVVLGELVVAAVSVAALLEGDHQAVPSRRPLRTTRERDSLSLVSGGPR